MVLSKSSRRLRKAGAGLNHPSGVVAGCARLNSATRPPELEARRGGDMILVNVDRLVCQSGSELTSLPARGSPGNKVDVVVAFS